MSAHPFGLWLKARCLTLDEEIAGNRDFPAILTKAEIDLVERATGQRKLFMGRPIVVEEPIKL